MSQLITAEHASAISDMLRTLVLTKAEPKAIHQYLIDQAIDLGLDPNAFSVGASIGIEAFCQTER